MEGLQKMDKVQALDKITEDNAGYSPLLTSLMHPLDALSSAVGSITGSSTRAQDYSKITGMREPVQPITPWGKWLANKVFSTGTVTPPSRDDLLQYGREAGLDKAISGPAWTFGVGSPLSKVLNEAKSQHLAMSQNAALDETMVRYMQDPRGVSHRLGIKLSPDRMNELALKLNSNLAARNNVRRWNANATGVVLGDVGITAGGAGLIYGGLKGLSGLEPLLKDDADSEDPNKKKKDQLLKRSDATSDAVGVLQNPTRPVAEPSWFSKLTGSLPTSLADSKFIYPGGVVLAGLVGPAAYMLGRNAGKTATDSVRDNLIENRKQKAMAEYQQLLAESLATKTSAVRAIDSLADKYVEEKQAGVISDYLFNPDTPTGRAGLPLGLYLTLALAAGGTGFALGNKWEQGRDKGKAEEEAYEKAIKLKQLGDPRAALQMPLPEDGATEFKSPGVLGSKYRTHFPIPKKETESGAEEFTPSELDIRKMGSLLVLDTLKKNSLTKSALSDEQELNGVKSWGAFPRAVGAYTVGKANDDPVSALKTLSEGFASKGDLTKAKFIKDEVLVPLIHEMRSLGMTPGQALTPMQKAELAGRAKPLMDKVTQTIEAEKGVGLDTNALSKAWHGAKPLEGVTAAAGNIADKVTQYGQIMKGGLSGQIFDALKGAFGGAGGMLKDVWSSIWGFLKNLWTGVTTGDWSGLKSKPQATADTTPLAPTGTSENKTPVAPPAPTDKNTGAGTSTSTTPAPNPPTVSPDSPAPNPPTIQATPPTSSAAEPSPDSPALASAGSQPPNTNLSLTPKPMPGQQSTGTPPVSNATPQQKPNIAGGIAKNTNTQPSAFELPKKMLDVGFDAAKGQTPTFATAQNK